MKKIPGMLRTMTVSPQLALANPQENAQEIAAYLRDADLLGVQLTVFPELSLTGVTCGDLIFQHALLEQAKNALASLAAAQANTAFVVGLPLEMGGRLYNCAAVVCGGEIAVVPKLYPGSDARYFAPGAGAPDSVVIGGREARVLRAQDAVFSCGDFSFGVCVGSDMTSPFSPAAGLCANGALLIANPAAEAETQSAYWPRANLLTALSRQLGCAWLYAGAGAGESTTDAVYGGYSAVCEAGMMLDQTPCFQPGSTALGDVDCERLRFRRMRDGQYSAFAPTAAPVPLSQGEPAEAHDLRRPLRTAPFIPVSSELSGCAAAALSIQTTGLTARMSHIGTKKLVLGVSGGLDSTLALLVAALAYDRAGWERENIVAVTMPGFGTGERTKTNADRLMTMLGCTTMEIPIGPAVLQHFEDIGQDKDKHDICYENSQARERTQILMDIANKVGGIVLGTGDLSELALGFCTYNGDQMSMYNVNGSIPKTLMRVLVMRAGHQLGAQVERVVADVVNTPVSPELLPGTGELTQRTEEVLGAYDLHDFFLWHMMDSGASPAKLYALACHAFAGQFDGEAIFKALDTFVRRFFTQQFKRSAMPDGPNVTGVSLSPRGGFIMPSDAQRALWMAELAGIQRTK